MERRPGSARPHWGKGKAARLRSGQITLAKNWPNRTPAEPRRSLERTGPWLPAGHSGLGLLVLGGFPGQLECELALTVKHPRNGTTEVSRSGPLSAANRVGWTMSKETTMCRTRVVGRKPTGR